MRERKNSEEEMLWVLIYKITSINERVKTKLHKTTKLKLFSKQFFLLSVRTLISQGTEKLQKKKRK